MHKANHFSSRLESGFLGWLNLYNQFANGTDLCLQMTETLQSRQQLNSKQQM